MKEKKGKTAPWTLRRAASGFLAFAMTLSMLPPPIKTQAVEVELDEGVQVLTETSQAVLNTTFVDGVQVDSSNEPDTLPPVPGMNTDLEGTVIQPIHWAESYLQQMVEYGYLREELAGDPDELLTRAEFMAVINRAYNYTQMGTIAFDDVTEFDWFYDDVAIATAAGFITGTSESTADPLENMTREMTSYILGKNMMLPEMTGENMMFADANEISEWSRGMVKSTSHYGLINGYSDGTFRPTEFITRGELAVLVLQAIGTPVQVSGEVEMEEVWGNVTITESGTVLKNTMIAGDLYISNGIGLGGVTLENVTVLGRIVVSGGESYHGDASIILRNVIASQMVVDNMDHNLVTVRIEGDSYIANTYIRTNAYIEDNTSSEDGLQLILVEATPGTNIDFAGRIKEVINISPGTFVRVVEGTVDTMTIDETAREVNTEILTGAVISNLNIDVSTNVTGDGDIGNVNVNASDVVIEMLPDNIEIRPGLDANINGEIMNSTTAAEFSSEPRILAGYPIAYDIAPTSFTAIFKTNKPGTIHYAISNITQGSVPEDDLLQPPTYGGVGLIYGSVSVLAAETEITHLVDGLEIGGSYYLTAILEDSRGDLSPIKVVAFTTPDNTVPAFAEGYPYMSYVGDTSAQVTAMATKTCKLYYAVLPAGSVAPTGAEFLAGSISGSEGSGVQDMIKNKDVSFTVSNSLLEMKDYVLYLWLTDADGSNFSEVEMLEFTTLDGTPPEFNQSPEAVTINATDVDFNFSINEDGTVYWIAVLAGTSYPKVSPSDTTGNATEPWYTDYAKLQVSQGMNGGVGAVAGSMDAIGNTTHTFNVSGLELETSYDLYYVAKDLAGNYSESIYMVTFNTLDNTPPEFIEQTFSHVASNSNSSEGVVAQPYASTSITLVFSEGIQSTYFENTTGQSFLQLYTAVTTATTSDSKTTARNNLAAALSNSITLYTWNGNTSTPVTERNKDNEYDADVLAGGWIIDYRYATVTMSGGLMYITFPTVESNDRLESALNLAAGVTYGFKLANIQDSSYDANVMVPAELTLDRFTTIYAEVMFGPASVMTELPNQRGADGKTIEGTFATLDDDLRITPGSMTNVDPDIVYEIRFNPNVNVSFNIYFRIVDEKGKYSELLHEYYPTYPTSELTNRLEQYDNRSDRIINSWEPDDNGWILLTIDNVATAYNEKYDTDPFKIQGDGNGIGIGFNYGFLGYQGSTVYPSLSSLGDDYQIEMLFEITSFQGSTTRGEWNGTLEIDTQMYAGNYTYIRGLGEHGNVTDTTYNNVSLVSTPSEYVIGRSFTDSIPPDLGPGAPQVYTEDIAADIEVSFDGSRVGTLYYAVVKSTSPSNLGPKDADGNDVLIDQVPDVNNIYYVEGQTWPSYPKGEFVLTTPDYLSIITYVDPQNSSLYGSIDGMDKTSQIISLENLNPETTYYIYMVTKSDQGGGYSTPVLYKFTTAMTERPQYKSMQSTTDNADVTFTTHVNTTLSYLMLTVSDAEAYVKMLNMNMYEFLKDNGGEASSGNPDPNNADYIMTFLEQYRQSLYWSKNDAYCYSDISGNGDYEYVGHDSYEPWTVREMLANLYSESGNYDHPEFTTNNYTGFDVFASEDMKYQLYQLIKNESGNSVSKGLDITIDLDTLITAVRSQTTGASPDAEYVFFVTGRNINSDINDDVEKTHSFRILDGFSVVDLTAPMLTGTSGNTAGIQGFDEDEFGLPTTFTGLFGLTFDKFLYAYEEATNKKYFLQTHQDPPDEEVWSGDSLRVDDIWLTNLITNGLTVDEALSLYPATTNNNFTSTIAYYYNNLKDGSLVSFFSLGSYSLSNKNGVTRDTDRTLEVRLYTQDLTPTVAYDETTNSSITTYGRAVWWATNWDSDWGSNWTSSSNTIPEYAQYFYSTVTTTGSFTMTPVGTGNTITVEDGGIYRTYTETITVSPAGGLEYLIPSVTKATNAENNSTSGISVSITNGLLSVTGNVEGEYEITIKHYLTGETVATITVTVNPVATVSLDATELTVVLGNSGRLTATIENSGEIESWKVNPNSGLGLDTTDSSEVKKDFTPTVKGDYAVIVTLTNGESAECKVTVKDPEIVVEVDGVAIGTSYTLESSVADMKASLVGSDVLNFSWSLATQEYVSLSPDTGATVELKAKALSEGSFDLLTVTATYRLNGVPNTVSKTIDVYSIFDPTAKSSVWNSAATVEQTSLVETYELLYGGEYDSVVTVKSGYSPRMTVSSSVNPKDYSLKSDGAGVVDITAITSATASGKIFTFNTKQKGSTVLTLTDNVTGETETILLIVE